MRALQATAVPLTGTTLIEASAGTGKTYTITTLVLRLLVERRLQVREVLVVTFTQAAAAELRDRVRRRLGEALTAIEQGAGFEQDAELAGWLAERRAKGQAAADRSSLQRALRDFDEAAICTIHAFCQRVLAEHAFESGTAFDAQLVEQQAPLLEEVAFDYWANVAYRAAPELLRGLRKSASPSKLLALAAKVTRDPSMPVLPAPAEPSAVTLAPFFAARDRAAKLWSAHRGAVLVQLCRPERLHRRSHPPDRIARDWALELDSLGEAQPLQLPDCVAKLTQPALHKATRKLQTVPDHPFFAALTELQEADAAIAAELAREVLTIRRRLVDYVRAQVQARRKRQGVQSFDDLLVQLRAALTGPAGAALAAKLTTRHPVALIDEFQDTDPIQYEIFQKLYGSRGTLFLIGDPKQAIYGFRGADIFAYLQAARHAGQDAYTLAVNHRSDPQLIAAINHLFQRTPRSFLLPEIVFQPVRPSAGARDHLDDGRAALQLLFVPRALAGVENNARGIPKGWGDRQLPRMIACEITELLHAAPRLGARALHPSDIAVLCRTNQQARDTARELARLGVPTVLDGDSSVFESDMAEELSRVLWAIARPADARKLGAALASSLFGVGDQALYQLRNDDAALERWLERLARWNVSWHERGFMQMWHDLLDEADVRARLLERSDGERRLTDLMHLSELMHEAAVQQHLGPLSLLHWFTQLRSDPQLRLALGGDSAQLRLEHDEHALRLTTIHRSKGLEYPIVFCPFSWADPPGGDDDVSFHDRADEDRLKLDLGSDQLQAHAQLAQREALAENLRLLYVALTRAKHRCYVTWGRFNRSGRSPLGYLLHAQPSDDEGSLDAVEQRLQGMPDAALRAELEAIAAAAPAAIGVREVCASEPRPYHALERPRGELRARHSDRELQQGARLSSFSRITAQRDREASAAAEESVERDPDAEPLEVPARPPTPQAAPRITLSDFPAGSGPGSMIHSIYEHIDFQRADPDELDRHVEAALSAHGLVPEHHKQVLSQAIAHSLTTPLDTRDPPLRLASVARSQRHAELEFLLETSGARAQLGPALAAAFERHGAPAASLGYVARLRTLEERGSAAFLRGFIDLVFRHEGRYFIVDYKSNHLGDHEHDYRVERLREVMDEHHYFLQYHLYALALHRHLALRIPGYDYDRCFGGVYYLFVRGMAPHHAPGTGVFFDRPSRALLESLSEALGSRGANR